MRIGDVIGSRFRIESELGREGSEVVWGAFDKKLERHVAIHRFVSDPDALRHTQRMRALETFVFDDVTWLVSERRKRRRTRSPLLPIALATVLVGLVAGGVVFAMRVSAERASHPIASASASTFAAPENVDGAPEFVLPLASASGDAGKPEPLVSVGFQGHGGSFHEEEAISWARTNKAALTTCLRQNGCQAGTPFSVEWRDRQIWVNVGEAGCRSSANATRCVQKLVGRVPPPVTWCSLEEYGCTAFIGMIVSRSD